MKGPIFLIDHGDISVFSSGRDLEGYVESPDISDYLVFDATGRQLELQSTIGRAGRVVDVNPVRLVEVGGMPPQPDTLRDNIRNFLSRLNVSTSDSDDLANLIGILVETVKYTK